MADLREAVKGDDAAAIAVKANALQRQSAKLVEAAHTSRQASSGPGARSADDGVVDAEFTEIDDDKK